MSRAGFPWLTECCAADIAPPTGHDSIVEWSFQKPGGGGRGGNEDSSISIYQNPHHTMEPLLMLTSIFGRLGFRCRCLGPAAKMLS